MFNITVHKIIINFLFVFEFHAQDVYTNVILVQIMFYIWNMKQFCSQAFQARNMQFRPLVRMGKIKMTDYSKCWREDMAGSRLHCYWECKLIQSLWKTVWRFPNQLQTSNLSYNPDIPFLGIYSRNKESISLNRDLCWKVPGSFMCKPKPATRTSTEHR